MRYIDPRATMVEDALRSMVHTTESLNRVMGEIQLYEQLEETQIERFRRQLGVAYSGLQTISMTILPPSEPIEVMPGIFTIPEPRREAPPPERHLQGRMGHERH